MFAQFRVSKMLCVGGAFLAFSMAVFGQTTNFTISVSSSTNNEGTVIVNGTPGGVTNTAVPSGTNYTVVAQADSTNYTFATWTLNGTPINEPTNFTFTLGTNITSTNTEILANFGLVQGVNQSPVAGFSTNAALVANFEPALTVAVSNSPSAGGTVGGGGIFASNYPVTVTATSASGYAFTNWTSSTNVVSTNASYTFTLSNDVVLVANFVPNPLITSGSEFPILGHPPGDQVLPSLSFPLSGGVGCIAWQDNVIDRLGGGLGASLLDGSFDAGRSFRVNQVVTGLQLKPQVQLLANDNMIFVWQGSVTATSLPNIYARFAKGGRGSATYGTNFYTSDILVNTYRLDQQVDPAVAGLNDGGAIITWSSYGEKGTGSMWGVYARKLTATGRGEPVKQFLVTQYTGYNQRNPAVTALSSGNYVIAWVSEYERPVGSVDIYARIFTPDGTPVTDEIAVNSGTNICHAPAVAPLNDGGFTVVWTQLNAQSPTDGWDIWGRAFSASGSPEVSDFTINTHLYGDQYAPKIAAGPSGSLVVWTSMGQDGSREGVFGRFLQGGTGVAGSEFQVNTTWISQQLHPAVAWDGVDHFLVVWTSFAGASGFDLYGQAYVMNPAQ